jgi:hypothetical protein
MDADKKKAKRMKREERRRQALLLEKQAGSSPETEHASLENKNKNKKIEHAPGQKGSESKVEKKRKKLGCQGGKAEKRTDTRNAESQDEEAAVCVFFWGGGGGSVCLCVYNTCILCIHTHTRTHTHTHMKICNIHRYTRTSE